VYRDAPFAGFCAVDSCLSTAANSVIHVLKG
jgi:hypothetical protein